MNAFVKDVRVCLSEW